jgi:hypothetical protein
MPTNLTGSTIASTFDQLLHVDDGPTATEKTVYGGTGVATALKVGTTSASVGNVQLTGNTVQATTGNLMLGSNIAFGSASNARTALGLGTMATQNSGAVAITGGTLSGVTVTGSFSGLTLVESVTLATANAAAGCNLNGSTLAADGTDANIDLNITPKGTGEVNITNIDVVSGKVPFSTITDRAYAAFSDVTDQTGSTTVPTPVKFGTTEVAGAGITMVTDGANLTRLTFAAAGTYAVMPNLQFANSDTADHDITVWFALNGTNIARSTTKISIPKASDGGSAFFQIVFYATVTASQYIQVYWLPENVAVTLDFTVPVIGPPAIPAIPSAIISAERIA